MARVLFFGKLADLAGLSETQYGDDMVLSHLVEGLTRDNPELSVALRDPTTRSARNLHLISRGDDPMIMSHDELAFMPPVSGG